MEVREPEALRVLVVAPIGRDASAAAELLSRGGVSTEVCRDLECLMEHLETNVAAVLLAEEAIYRQDTTALTTWVREQPAWSDLPFVILTSHLTHPNVSSWRRELVGMLRNVSLLERPVQAITLTSTVQAAMRARRRQYELKALVEAQAAAAVQLEDLVSARTRELQAANEELRTQMIERTHIEDSLRQAQKIEALGQLTGGVAHDFNNLLMVILGGLEMLDHTDEAARRKLLMDGMRQAAHRGASLTRQLLAFSRRQALQPQPVDLARQIGGMRELLARSLGGNVQVQLELSQDLWPVHVDPGELELVVLNLAVNARDAMPKGGAIVIRARNVPSLRLDGLRGDFVRLSIIDTGVGMTTEVQRRVFEPFFTTKDVGKGSGLGLAQVYGFAQQSGGNVQIESEVGRGTTVALLLPRSESQPERDGPAPEGLIPEAGARGAAGAVLLVEDDDDVAVMVSRMLGRLGYRVSRVASASSALATLEGDNQFDLVFSDIMMPGDMDGVELGRELRQRGANIPVLLTSGYADAASGRAESEGFGVLRKPYSLAELAMLLKSIRG
ncbi:ATP-binding protein [Steroidobacter flavus]|uniref:histidine kinase n=1 Tax=Steroidobacter flavus TaxID=1842136 RepID=A0ABV8T3N8_9GAMM